MSAAHTPMVLRAARALSDASAAAWDVDAEDNWKVYSEDFIADATAALDAAGAPELLTALRVLRTARNLCEADRCRIDAAILRATGSAS